MSGRTSNQGKHQRFSGPELAPLLSRVVDELGSTAAITEVNKIRSGGVGGFFCREEFEVIVEGSSRGESGRGRGGGRADPGRSDLVDSGGPRDLDASDARFRALLERRLTETSLAEADLAQADLAQQRLERHLEVDEPITSPHRPGTAGDSVDVVDLPSTAEPDDRPFVVQPPKPATFGVADLAPVFDTDRRERNPTATARPGLYEWDVPAAEARSPENQSDFWLRLRRTRRELEASRPPDPAMMAVVGPLALTTPVVRLLQCRHRLDPDDVVVLTSRAEIVSEPAWQLVRSSHQMVDAARDRSGRPTLLVIDVPVALPVWVGPLLDRLRRADLGLVRFAVPGTPSGEHLAGYRDRANLPYVIDLVSRSRPDDLARLVDVGHPIATIAGIELNAELLMALREQVSLG